MSEVWKPAAGFEGHYEVSNLGRCRSAKSTCGTRIGLVLRPGLSRGYQRVVLVNLEIRKNIQVHRLIYESFVGPIPAGMQINHKNGQKADNRLENLEVVTPSENTLHGFRSLGRKPVKNPQPGAENGRAKLTEAQLPEIFRLRELGWSQQRIADKLGIHQTNISRVLLGQSWNTVSRIKL